MALASSECVFAVRTFTQSVGRLNARAASIHARANATPGDARVTLRWRSERDAFRADVAELQRQVDDFIDNEPAARQSPLPTLRELRRGMFNLSSYVAGISDR
jgi:hypothetical protein